MGSIYRVGVCQWWNNVEDLTITLAADLLRWWIMDGRHDPFQKPCMFPAAERWLAPQGDLQPYPTWVAEAGLTAE